MMRWRVIRGKVHFPGNGKGGGQRSRRLVAGDEFDAEEADVQGFRDLLEVVPPAQPKEPDSEREVQHRGGPYYDVVDKATGEKVNDKALKKSEAEGLL